MTKFDPDIVVVADRGLDDPAYSIDVQLDDRRFRFGTPEFEAALQDATKRSVQALRKSGRAVVMIEPLPVSASTFNPLTCLSKAKYMEDCRYVATPQPTQLERYYRSLADGHSVWSLDLDHLVCPYFPICDTVVSGKIVKADRQHLTEAYAKSIAGPTDTLLRSLGILR